MRIRLSLIYTRFLLVELVKLAALTVAVVVVVGAFALAIKPLADGRIGPADALRIMAYMSVPMLQYALPFAAGLAATLAYHRMAQDNELTACFAGGISHKAVLAPALLGGIVAAGILFTLADQAMPRLLRKAQDIVTEDVSRLIGSAVARREAISIGNRALYAEQFTRPPGVPPAPAYDHFVLSGVVAVETDGKGNVLKEASAKHAYVWLYRQAERASAGAGSTATAASGIVTGDEPGRAVTTAVLKFAEPVGSLSGKGTFELEQSSLVLRIADSSWDDPKYYSWSELNEIRDKPERMNEIDGWRRELAAKIAERAVVKAIADELSATGLTVLRDGAGRSVAIRAAGFAANPDANGYAIVASTGRAFNPANPLNLPGAKAPSGDIEIIAELDDGGRLHRAKRAWLTQAGVQAGGELASPGTLLELRMEDVTTSSLTRQQMTAMMQPGAAASGPGTDPSITAAGSIKEYSLTGIVPQSDVLAGLLKLSINDLLLQAGNTAPGDARIDGAAGTLRTKTAEMIREINSKQNERVAASLACIAAVLCGAIMALRLKDSLPLPVYLWSFLPALGALFSISGGQSVMYRQGPIGLLLLYGGVAALLAWTAWQYRQLARH